MSYTLSSVKSVSILVSLITLCIFYENFFEEVIRIRLDRNIKSRRNLYKCISSPAFIDARTYYAAKTNRQNRGASLPETIRILITVEEIPFR